MAKFKIGDETDLALCATLKHEFLRCRDAFEMFAASAEHMILKGENRVIAVRTYNAYAWFVHHLYEFLLGAVQRDRQDTAQLDHQLADKYIQSYAERALQKRRSAILDGTAPSWENHISAFPEHVATEFSTEFRKTRNTISGHVKHQRHSLSLTVFYDRYHKYLYMTYFDSLGHWGYMADQFPDLGEITAFSVMVKDVPLSSRM